MNYIFINQEKHFKELDMIDIMTIFHKLIYKVLCKNFQQKHSTHIYYEGKILNFEDSIICLN
jgi:hypothetical protein